jgi:hypothetical protein
VSGDFRSTLLHALRMSLDIFTEGSLLYNNTKSAIAKVDRIADDSGTGFATERYRRGVMTILSEAFDCLADVDNVGFRCDDLDEAIQALASAPTVA